MAQSPEAGVQKVMFDSFPATVQVEGPNNFRMLATFQQPVANEGFLPHGQIPNLDREQIGRLVAYADVSGQELAFRVGYELTRRSEHPSGNTRASEQSYMMDSNTGFRERTEEMLTDDFKVHELQEQLRIGARPVRQQFEGNSLVRITREQMEKEIELIDKTLKEGPQE